MEMKNMPQTTKLPSVVKTIGEAMDLVSKNVTLLIMPLLLDLFLLFGPRLRVYELLKGVVDALLGQVNLNLPQNLLEQYAQIPALADEMLQSSNLFGALKTIPIGVPSLLAAGTTPESPLGAASTMEIGSYVSVALIWLGLTLVGIVLGTIFFRMVAAKSQLGPEPRKVCPFPRQLLNIGIFYLAMIVLLCLLMIPGSCGLMMFMTNSPQLYQLIAVIYSIAVIWLVVPFFFTPHAIFVKGEDFLPAVKSSLHIIRWGASSATFFIIISCLLSAGLDLIWGIPELSSWLVIFSIFGHAFISTALLAAAFLLFQKYEKWQEENQEFINWRKSLSRFSRRQRIQ